MPNTFEPPIGCMLQYFKPMQKINVILGTVAIPMRYLLGAYDYLGQPVEILQYGNLPPMPFSVFYVLEFVSSADSPPHLPQLQNSPASARCVQCLKAACEMCNTPLLSLGDRSSYHTISAPNSSLGYTGRCTREFTNISE